MVSQTAQHSDKTAGIVFLCVLCAGVLLLLIAVQATIELVQLRLFGHETSGRIIRQDIRKETVTRHVNKQDVREEIDSYYAVVSFTTDEGTFSITSYDSGTNAPLYPTDSSVTVVYRPGNPERARLQQEIIGFRGIFGPLMLIGFGIVCTGFGILPTLLAMKEKQQIQYRLRNQRQKEGRK